MHETRVEALKHQVTDALAGRRGIAIHGAGTRGVQRPPLEGRAASAGRAIPGPVGTGAGHGQATMLDLTRLTGVLDWEPEELVIAVAAGTPLIEVEAVLAEGRQRLLGEPWLPAAASTVGGAVATGLSGPGRPWLGSLSDGVLGVRLLSAPGGRLVDGRFGGRVIKNVAGFDVSRLQVGACGVFGVLLEVNLRVAPVPACSRCLWADLGVDLGLARMLELEPPAWPATGVALEGGRLHLRLEGEPSVVDAATRALGSDFIEESPVFWQELRAGRLPRSMPRAPLAADFDRSVPTTQGADPSAGRSVSATIPARDAHRADSAPGAGGLDGPAAAPPSRHWRVVVPRGTPPLALPGDWLIDWGGSLQWWRTSADLPVPRVLAAARAVGGQALPASGVPFSCLSGDSLMLHRALACELDPAACFNRGLLDGRHAGGGP